MPRSRTAFALLAILSLSSACTRDAPPTPGVGRAGSVRVTVAAADRGTAAMRRAFSLDPEPLTVDFEVLDADGILMEGFEGSVEVRIEPGSVARVALADGTETIGPEVPISGGVARGVRVYAYKVYGDARIWAEEIGYVPADPTTARCANGEDDDADGAADYPIDPGCRYANDDDEGEGTHAAGVSDLLYFANPHLADVQGRSGISPLQGRLVRISEGEMIVTNISTDGFYVSEIEHDPMTGLPTGRAVPWGSLFVFNFNTPPYLRSCDRILELSGSVGEFFGFTELNQPSWRREKWCSVEGDPSACIGSDGRALEPRPCPIPDATVITSDVLGTPEMEALESSVVRIVDARIPMRFGPAHPPEGSNCDFDGSGDIDFDIPEEDACNDACSADPDCSEWTAFTDFGQYAIQTAGGVVSVWTSETIPDFDPTDHRGETFPAVTGVLRSFAPLGLQRGYILVPRCEADLTLPGGTPIPPSEACVVPRTGGAIEPD